MKKVLCLFITAIITLSLCLTVSAVYEGTVNLAKADRNLSGDGYYWSNTEDTLTLEGLDIVTGDDFGMKIPAGARVIVNGTNRIKAGKYGIGCPGNAIFEGDGKLIIEAADGGIYSYSTNANHKILFTGGTYEITAGTGILADCADVSLTGGTFAINSADYAVSAATVSVTGGSVGTGSSLHASHLLVIDRAEIEVTSPLGALLSDNLLEIRNVKLMAGDSLDSLEEKEFYEGEMTVRTKPLKMGVRRSVLFGDEYPITLDYALLAAAIVLIVCAVVLPILRKKRKTKKMLENLNK
ncbi:MAG: carbohydrate-binding domain-containing protein [Clostridia bacterium]|nr:carbohydrate-binding domain-containing protein [Clostridia bacterium]